VKPVFLGGSRKIPRLNDAIRKKLDELVARSFWILVGDANGADRAIQQHFANRGYERVTVYSVTGVLRNNLGHWKVRSVDAPSGARGFDLFSVKDAEMARDATAGLMLWDGKSRGTLENVRRLLAEGKPVSVYLGPTRRFVSLRLPVDLAKLGIGPSATGPAQTDLPFGASLVHDQPAPPLPRSRRKRGGARGA
jgi:adenine-specific DNA-methyltransferase